jgi:serine protease Do
MIPMPRRFLIVTMCLVGTVTFLIGLIVAGSLTPTPAHSAPGRKGAVVRPAKSPLASPALASFAEVAERINPAVVNIDATSRGTYRDRSPSAAPRSETPGQFGRAPERERQGPRRGAGAGFIIDPDGYILTNHHLVEDAERLTVRLADGRSLRAEAVGSDPDTDIALIKVSAPRVLPYATLGDSDTLRVGDWVLAIGNPLAYEHTVTAGVVSFIGRKLFDSSLDRYIQTDAAIGFGSSGGPLVNSRGEVIGINAAISSRASNIGFAVPINQATEILPQLRQAGRVTRGYIGVGLRDVDPDLQRSLGLNSSTGAMVVDVRDGSPGARAGLRPYDVIVAVDGKPVDGNDALIQLVASGQPGTTATLNVVRDGRALTVVVKLAERASIRESEGQSSDFSLPVRRPGSLLGLSVREIDAEFSERYDLPKDMGGVLVARVDPMGPAIDADIERGNVLLEINRRPIRSVDDFRRLTANARPGDVLALYLFKPEIPRRELRTVRVD